MNASRTRASRRRAGKGKRRRSALSSWTRTAGPGVRQKLRTDDSRVGRFRGSHGLPPPCNQPAFVSRQTPHTPRPAAHWRGFSFCPGGTPPKSPAVLGGAGCVRKLRRARKNTRLDDSRPRGRPSVVAVRRCAPAFHTGSLDGLRDGGPTPDKPLNLQVKWRRYADGRARRTVTAATARSLLPAPEWPVPAGR